MSDHHHTSNKKILAISFAIITLFMIVEVIGGWVTNSLALLSDAGHMLSDSVSLAIALMAFILSERAVSKQNTFGYKRFEVLAAAFNGLTLLVMRHVLKLDPEFFICEPDKRYGELLLEIIEEGGNFGHHSKYHIKKGASKFRRFVRYVTRNTKLICYYPNEIIWHFRHKVRRFFSRK